MKEKSIIAFYISSHGFGHLTRCIPIIEKLSKKYRLYIVSGRKQLEFLKEYLGIRTKNFFLRELDTDIGLINCNKSLEVDRIKLEMELEKFVNNWEYISNMEVDYLKDKKVKKIIVDISPIGMLVGNKLNLKVEAFSNFTWFTQYKFLNLNKKILDKFYEVEQYITRFFVYPLNLDLSHINCEKIPVNYIARKFNYSKINKLRKKYNKIIFISCGKSADLERIEIKNFNGIIFYTEGIEIFGEGEHIKLPLNTKDTHNYVGASDFVIVKAGWGTVAEAVLSEVPMVLLERDGVLEDTNTIAKLKKQNKAISIEVKKLKILDIEDLENKIEKNFKNK